MMWARIRQIFTGRNSGTSAKSGPVVAEKIARSVERLIAEQRADADAKDKNTAHWGQTGSIVRRAANECAAVLLPTPDGDGVSAYFGRVLPGLAALADHYRHDDGDADGYGLGTVREIEEAIRAMATTWGIVVWVGE